VRLVWILEVRGWGGGEPFNQQVLRPHPIDVDRRYWATRARSVGSRISGWLCSLAQSCAISRRLWGEG
jgi:hypothetical protein